MSHDKIKAITINEKENTVYVTSASNNVYPRTYHRGRSSSLEEILKTKGRDELDRVLLAEFDKGNFQDGQTDYNLVGKIYGERSLENLNRLRQLKKDTKGQKFVIACKGGYIGKFTARGAKVYASRHNAKPLSMVDALVKSKNFSDVEVLPA